MAPAQSQAYYANQDQSAPGGGARPVFTQYQQAAQVAEVHWVTGRDSDTRATQNSQPSASAPHETRIGQGTLLPRSSNNAVARPAPVIIGPEHIPGYFGAYIYIPGQDKRTHDTLRHFHYIAIDAQRHVPTPGNIEVNLFVDGSHSFDTSNGGYAVVYNRFVHGSITDQEVVRLGFQLKPGLNNLVAEGAALAEGLTLGPKEVARVILALLAQSPDPSTTQRILRTRVVLRVFSDCLANLMVLKKTCKWPSGDKARVKVLELCILRSHEALRIPGFPNVSVDVDVIWVPAHRRHYQVDLHTLADEAAGEARKLGSFRMIRNYKMAISAEGSVVAPLQQLFRDEEVILNRLRPARKRKLEEDSDSETADSPTRLTKKPRRNPLPLRRFARQQVAVSRRAHTSSEAILAVVLWRRPPFPPTTSSPSSIVASNPQSGPAPTSMPKPGAGDLKAHPMLQFSTWLRGLEVRERDAQVVVMVDTVLRRSMIISDGSCLYLTLEGVKKYGLF